MSERTVETLLKQLLALPPDEQREILAKLNSHAHPAEDAFGKMLQELGIGKARRAGPRAPNPTPVRVEGKPLSEQLI